LILGLQVWGYLVPEDPKYISHFQLIKLYMESLLTESIRPGTLDPSVDWKPHQKILLRGFFLFVALTTVSLNPTFYQQDFGVTFQTNSHPWRYLDVLSQNSPWFFSNASGKNYLGWLITLSLSLGAGFLWQLVDAKRRDFTSLNYWFTVLVRYGLALRLSWFALAKVFPVQMPFPTISQLNTRLGDFTPGKLYWLTTGVSPVFEVFAGVFELIATVLLLSRRTTTLGALMVVAILVPIWFVNIGYDAGVELTSLHILTLALILLVPDANRFWNLLIRHQADTLPEVPAPAFAERWKRIAQIGLKTTFILVFFLYRGIEYGRVYAAGKTFKLPLSDGLAEFTGYYDVPEFRLNNQVIPYSPTDTLRWQNVIFEKHNTISFAIQRPVPLNIENKSRTTEYYGNKGRFYYSYIADTLNRKLLLKNRADTTQQIWLHYRRPGALTIELKGVDERNDSIYAVLLRNNRNYPLVEKKVGL
jgi:uncharacterized membrane protein YphA (DoxX/SURF4 family)